MISPKSKPYVVFLDDTPRNFGNSHKVLGLKSPSSTKTPNVRPELSWFAKRAWKQHNLHETYDAASGIPTAAFYLLARIVRDAPKDVDQVILDWDKTLSVHSSFRSEVINKSTTEGYFGGWRRMRAIRYFFKTLNRYKIPVLILTANGRAKRDTASFHKALSYVNGQSYDVTFTDQPKTTYITKYT